MKRITPTSYPWAVARRAAGLATARTGIKHVAVTVAAGEQWGPGPYTVIPLGLAKSTIRMLKATPLGRGIMKELEARRA